MHTHHNNKKLLQKALFDKRHKVQPKPVYVGDKVLLKQEKSTTKPPFDLHPISLHKVLEAKQDQNLFQLETDTVNQKESLLESALGLQNCTETEATTSSSQEAQRFEQPMTCTTEKKLKWNPNMNCGPVVLLDSDSDM